MEHKMTTSKSTLKLILPPFNILGTYIGSIRMEGNKPTQMPIDSKFSFGASTRKYILRERPQGNRPTMVYLASY
jgi:hypothetical protein